MRIRRVRLVLPPRYHASAAADARHIAAAAAEALYAQGALTAPAPLSVAAGGRPAAALAREVARGMTTATRARRS